MGGIVNAVGDLLGIGPASQQASATKSAASQAAASANYAMELQKAIADRQLDFQREAYQKQLEIQEPWRAAGVNALNRIEAREFNVPGEFRATTGLPGAFQAKTALPGAFTGQVNMMADPGYQFRLSEGLKALDRQAAARGGLISGSALKGAQRYGQDYASGEYQNAYNRALTEYNTRVQQSQMGYGREMDKYRADLERSQIGYGRELDAYNAALQRSTAGYNRLASLAGLGQTSVGQIGSAAGQYGQNVSNALGTYGSNVGNISMANAANQGNAALSLGNIRASQYGSIGAGLNQALGTNWGQVGNNLNSLFGGGGGSVYGMGSINPSSGEYYGSLEF